MKSIMNKIRLAALMAAAATLFGGCEKENDNAVDNTPVAARITSGIDGMATRAAGTAWAADDAIGVTGMSGTVEYKNVKYVTTDGDGVFTPDGGADNNIYFQNKEDVTFTAYYPYTGTNGTAAGVITATTYPQTPEEQAKYDFLFDTATGSSANPNVQFRFKHCMSRLVLNFQPGNGISSLGDIRYSLYIIQIDGTFDTTTGEAKADIHETGLRQDVPSTTPGMSSSLILFPQNKSRVSITILMGEVQYSGTIDFPASPADGTKGIEAGKCYTYNIKVNNSTLTISPATIDNWGEGGSENIDSTN